MASGGKEIRAGKAYVELSTRDRVSKGLTAIENRLKSFGTTVTSIGTKFAAMGAIGVGGAIAAGRAFASMGDQVAKASARTGVGVEALSQLNYAAAQSGTDAETLEASFKKMAKGIVDAGEGTGEAKKAFEELGLSAAHLASISPDKQFELIADRIGGVTDPTRRAALAMDIFGKSGTALIPLMADGAAGIQALRQQADNLGLTLSTKDAKAAEEFGDRMDDLMKVVQASVYQIGAALSPALQAAAVKLTEVTSSAVQWLQSNRQQVQQWGELALKVALGAVALGGILIVLGKLIAIGGTAIATIKGISVAMMFLAANPVVAVAALTAALAGMYVVMRTISNASADLRDAMAQQVVAAQQQRVATKQALDTLEALSTKQRLTVDEANTANAAIAALSKTYGDLGLRVNQATGQLEGLAEASANVRQQETQAEVQRLNQAIVERKDNVRALKQEMDQLTGGSDLGLGQIPTGAIESALDKLTFVASGGNSRIKAIAGQIQKEQAAMGQLKLRRQELASLGADVFGDSGRTSAENVYGKSVTEVNQRLRQQLTLLNERRAAALAAGDGKKAEAVEKERVDAVEKAQDEIERIRKEAQAKLDGQKKPADEGLTGDAKAVSEVTKRLHEQLEALRTLQDVAAKRDAGVNHAAWERKRVDAVRKAEEEISRILATEEEKRIADARSRTDTELQAIGELQNAAKGAGDLQSFERLEKRRVDLVRATQAEINKIREESAGKKVEEVRTKTRVEVEDLDTRAADARDRGDTAAAADLESKRVAIVRAAEAQVLQIRRQSAAQQLQDVRSAAAAQVKLIEGLQTAAVARQDKDEWAKLERDRVAVVQSVETQIAALRKGMGDQAAADAVAAAEDADRQVEAIRARARGQVENIDIRQQAAIDNGEIGTAGLLEFERQKAIVKEEEDVKAIRARSIQEQTDNLRAGLNEQLRIIDAQAQAALDAADNATWARLQEERLRIVQETEQKITAARKTEQDKQAAYFAGRAQEELQRDQEKKRREQGQQAFMLGLEAELAKKQRNNPRAKELEKQLGDMEFEGRLDSTFGNDEAKKKKARDIQAQIDAMPDVKHSSQGIFNAAAIQSLQGTATEQRIAQATEQTAKNTKDIVRKGGPKFT